MSDLSLIMLSAMYETVGIVSVEEHGMVGGLGSAIAELLLDQAVARPRLKRLAVPDGHFAPVGSQQTLRKVIGDIEGAVLSMLAVTA